MSDDREELLRVLAERCEWRQAAGVEAGIRRELAAVIETLTTPRPLDEYHEDMGDVLWWKFPITEAPYVGSPNDCGFTVEAHTTTRLITQVNQEHNPEPVVHRINVGGWPGYHTHFTPIPTVNP